MDGTRIAYGDGLFEPIGRVVVWCRFVGAFLIGKNSLSRNGSQRTDPGTAGRIQNGQTAIRYQRNRSIDD